MAKSLRKEQSYSFPRGPMTLGNAVKEAELALVADYSADVNGVVEELKAKVDSNDLGTGESLRKAIDEVLENHPRCTVKRKSMMGLVASKNWDAGMEEDLDFDWGEMMMAAMRLDVIEGLDAAGVDTADLYDGDDEEDEDDDEEGDDE